MPEEIWSLKTILLFIFYCISLPFILLAFDLSLIKYWQIHIFISVILLSVVIFFRLKKIYSRFYYPISLNAIFVYPIFLLAAYPFNFFTIGLTLILLLLGFYLPFYSIKLTWWFYTIGGLTPVPKEHEWLQTYAKVTHKRGLKPKEMMNHIIPIMVVMSIIIMLFSNVSESLNTIILTAIFQLCSFFSGLTFSARFKRMLLFKEV